ncbi:unnamed protein product, partial [Ectocarpus sp. 8 AP-2014]
MSIRLLLLLLLYRVGGTGFRLPSAPLACPFDKSESYLETVTNGAGTGIEHESGNSPQKPPQDLKRSFQMGLCAVHGTVFDTFADSCEASSMVLGTVHDGQLK